MACNAQTVSYSPKLTERKNKYIYILKYHIHFLKKMKKIPRQKSNVSFYFSTRLRQWNRFLCRSVFRDHLLREPQLHSSSHGLWKDDPAQGTGQLGDFRAIQHEMIVSDTSQGTGRESNLYVIDWLATVVVFLFFLFKVLFGTPKFV